MSVELSSLEKTLVVPLWHRAQASKAHPELLNDVKAIELVNHFDYDFSIFTQRITVEDSHLKLIDQTPAYFVPRDPAWGEQTLGNIDASDLTNALSIVHLCV